MGRTDHCLYFITSGPMLFLVLSLLHFSLVPLRGLRSKDIVDYLSCVVHNGARCVEHDYSSMTVRLEVTGYVQAASQVMVTLSRDSGAPEEHCILLRWYIRLNEHLAKVFQLLRATDFLRE